MDCLTSLRSVRQLSISEKHFLPRIFLSLAFCFYRHGTIILGIIMDNKWSFSSHFRKVYAKIKKGLNGLTMVKNQLSFRAKLNVYYSLINSHLEYCALIWISSITKK